MKLIVVLLAGLIAVVIGHTEDKYKKLILDTHNEYRRKQHGSNIEKLVSCLRFIEKYLKLNRF